MNFVDKMPALAKTMKQSDCSEILKPPLVTITRQNTFKCHEPSGYKRTTCKTGENDILMKINNV